jgi:hypothetical protein
MFDAVGDGPSAPEPHGTQIAGIVAAHAVRNRPIAAFSPDEQRVFVHLPAKPNVGFRDAIEGHQASPASRNTRRD